MNERERLLRRVRAADFAVIDAGLYLNTHPECPDGLEYFRRARSERDSAARAYEAAVGPLTVDSASADGGWDWIAEPWPWEMEA